MKSRHKHFRNAAIISDQAKKSAPKLEKKISAYTLRWSAYDSKAKYQEARVIVLDDNFNTFQHVANCFQRYGEVILNRQIYIMSNSSAED